MTVTMTRDPEAAAANRYDLIVVGGGIYGVTATLEAARRGLKVALVEAGDFNHGTSYNSLRILHGGLRYLQSMDLPRFFESTAERRWFMQHYPELTGRLRCLLPLYNQGLKRPSTFGAALKLNDLLARRRNLGVAAANHLRVGRILTPDQAAAVFPGIVREGLTGAGAWDDGYMVHHQRLTMELLRWAVSAGATVLNYCPVGRVTIRSGAVTGVSMTDRLTGRSYELTASKVLSTTGPATRAFAKAAGDDMPELFMPSLAFNLLIDQAPPSDHALALTPHEPDARTYFLTPSKGRMLVGTYHMAWPAAGVQGDAVDRPVPPESAIQAFVEDLNKVVPDLKLRRDQVLEVLAGFLPAHAAGEADTAHRPVLVDHGQRIAALGLYSVSGVKWTTARLEAQCALRVMWAKDLPKIQDSAKRPAPDAIKDFATYEGSDDAVDAARRMVALESVVCLDDIVQRRTCWGETPRQSHAVTESLRAVIDLPEHAPDGPGIADAA